MRYLYILLGVVLLSACHKMKIGYLEVDAVKYDPNIMVVKKVLDPNNPDDANRIEFGSHWVSSEMQGLIGTQPIEIAIERVDTKDGDVEKFLEEITVRGNGTFDIPLYTKIPEGTYVIGLRVSNEDHCHVVDSVFTVIVK